jgi:metal-sulfur cluster biosynthetic enzyme
MSPETLQTKVIEEGLRQLFDPELPVNIYDLGLIYDVTCHTEEQHTCDITMTFTSPTCSMSDILLQLVESLPMRIEELDKANVHLVFDPPWDQSKMSDEAKLTLGLL